MTGALLPSLTLNLGLAWDMTTPITEEHNRMADYIPSTGQLLIAGQNGVSNSAGINMYWGAYEPRVGLTWKVLGSDKTVLASALASITIRPGTRARRACGKIRPTSASPINSPLLFQRAAPFQATSYCASLPGATVENVSTTSGGFPPLPTPQNVASFVGTSFTSRRTSSPAGFTNITRTSNASCPAMFCSPPATPVPPAAISWSSATTSTSAAPPHALRKVSGYTIGCLPGGAPYIYPYTPPNFNAILLYGDVGKTHYNSLQIKAETKTPKYGLYALVAYTYSRTYDNGLSDGLGSELSAPYPACSARAAALSVASQVNSGSVRPKWP
jgi:hypothetical protein